MNNKVKTYITIAVLGMAGGSIYCLPYLKYVFYDQMITAMHVNDSQLGLLMSVYAIACIIIYIPGGIISDRVSSKKSIIGSLFITTILTVIYGSFPSNYALSLGIWFLLAFTTIFLCWPAIMKTVRSLGKNIGVSTAYGTYYAFNGLTGGIINIIALTVYGHFVDKSTGFFFAMLVLAIFTVIIPIVLIIMLRDFKEANEGVSDADKVKVKDIGIVLKNSQIWLIALILFCTYSVFTGVTYFNPYLTNVYHVSEGISGLLTILRTFVFMMLAPLAGFMADKVFHSTLKWFLVGLTCAAVPTLFLMLFTTNLPLSGVLIITLIPAFFMAGLYSIMYSIINECGFPMKVAGTAIGVASLFANLPDLLIHTYFGHLLDSYGTHGWTLIFLTMVVMAIIAFVTCIILIKKRKKVMVVKEV